MIRAEDLAQEIVVQLWRSFHSTMRFSPRSGAPWTGPPVRQRLTAGLPGRSNVAACEGDGHHS